MYELIAVFFVGLLGSAHCIGMCGTFAGANALVAARSAEGRGRGVLMCTALSRGMLFNCGRTITYMFLGILVGFIGASFAGAHVLKGSLRILAGVMMVVIGLGELGIIPRRWLPAVRFDRSGKFARILGFALGKSSLTLGILVGFIPCGLVYAMLSNAASHATATGTPLSAVLVMMFFGLGTMPAMVGFGLATNALGLGFRKRAVQVAACLVVVMGLISVSMGLVSFGHGFHAS